MSLDIQKNELLSNHTTLQVGGPAEYFVTVRTTDELQEALQYAKEHTTNPPLILGGGSNVLCADAGYKGVVILNRIDGFAVQAETESTVTLAVGAGEVFDDIVERTIEAGYWGLENLSAIPGSVGATPIQNVGAYGVEIEHLIHSVVALHTKTLEEKVFTPKECAFGYRDSFFKSPAGKEWCVTRVVYALSKVATPELSYKDLAVLATKDTLPQAEIRQHVIAVRAGKFPDWRTVGTAGSFFKNPVIDEVLYNELTKQYPELPGFPTETGIKVPLGWILDKVCHLRGYQKDHVRLYEAQALVLVADAGATAAEIEQFAASVIQIVAEKTGIPVEREVLSV